VYQLRSQPEGESGKTRFHMAMYNISRNRQQAVRLLGEMNMPPSVSSTLWNKTNTKIPKASQAVAEETKHRPASELSDGTGGSRAVTVSCDGSWQRRGFQKQERCCDCAVCQPLRTKRELNIFSRIFENCVNNEIGM